MAVYTLSILASSWVGFQFLLSIVETRKSTQVPEALAFLEGRNEIETIFLVGRTEVRQVWLDS